MKKGILFAFSMFVIFSLSSLCYAGGSMSPLSLYTGIEGTGSNIPYNPLTAAWDAGSYEIRAESFYADAATTNWLFRVGDGDTGMKEVVDDVIDWYFSDVAAWRMRSTVFGIQGSSGPYLFITSSSYTTPTFVIRGSDADTGLAHGGDDTFSAVAGEVEFLRATEVAGTVTVTFPNGYTRHIQMQAGSATLGPNAPTATTIGTARGFGLDADNEELFFEPEIPPDWATTTDMTLEIFWSSESGDAILDTEVVKFDANYRSIAPGETVDNGTAVEITDTYTQSGAGTDKEFFETEITVDFDHADQPLTMDDTFFLVINRDITGEGGNSYSGLAIIYRVELKYTADKMPYQ